MTKPEAKSPPAGEIQTLVERAMALANATTPGPWRADTNNGCKQIKAGKDGDHRQAKWRTEVCSTPGLANEDEDAANAAFIAASRQLIPELCEAITRLSTAPPEIASLVERLRLLAQPDPVDGERRAGSDLFAAAAEAITRLSQPSEISAKLAIIEHGLMEAAVIEDIVASLQSDKPPFSSGYDDVHDADNAIWAAYRAVLELEAGSVSQPSGEEIREAAAKIAERDADDTRRLAEIENSDDLYAALLAEMNTAGRIASRIRSLPLSSGSNKSDEGKKGQTG